MIGKIISHYKILEKLGEGGMGEVFLAEDTKLKRKVALKFLPLKMTSDKEARKRFEREAEAAAALNHPNIVTIHEINEFENQIYIAMEYIEGETLKEKVSSSNKRSSGKARTTPLKIMRIEEIIDIAIQVSEGLEEAHQAGIIHRDITLQNVILDKSNRVKILDFGLAKPKGASRITREIFIVGTADYMSPEQALGKELDLRTDIWSLGVVLYKIVTGQLPFKGENDQALIYSIIYESPPPPIEIRDDLPAGLEKIILKCLQKDRRHRYPSMQPLLSDLKRLEKSLKRKGEKHEAKAYQKEKSEIKKETERRQATVMFAEISAYNEMLEKLGAEETASIMNSCFEMFGSVVEKYGGRIDKIMESSIKILFGVPAAIEEAPKEAINTAIEMRNQLYQLNQEKNLPIPLDIHIGINTGMVIAGAIGRDEKRDYSVMGDTVTLASQLKELSAKGQIYVGSLTYRNTRNEFEYKPLKPIILEGKTKPVPIFELLSTRGKIYRPEFGLERMIYSEMVGRDKELDKLKLHVLKVINGEGSILSVIGEAGIGKSRLIAELKKIEELKKVTLLEGRALSIGKNLSYFPIIDILKNWAAIKEEDSEKESLSKLEQAIANIYPDPEGAEEVFPFVATLMGMKLTGKHAERIKGIEGEAMEKLILKNIRELMIKSAERRPFVYIILDIHWADISSIELLESLFRLAENHKILFIIELRPNYKETGERVLETINERYGKVHSEIYLEPLDEKECEILIRNLVKVSGLPTDIRAAITNRTEGNPFFIEEVVRSFFDEGVIELKEGKFKVTEKISSVVIPETIQDVLMTRIDRLDETARTLLKEASVIGRYFFYKILAELLKTTEDIDDKLEYLKGIQLIQERTRLEEIEYLFKHALAQEVTYESILLKKRKELHLNVAHAIESVFSERLYEFYGMLALHYSKGENLEKAEEYLIKAGEEALKSAASTEALTYYQEALKLYLKNVGNNADPGKITMLEKNIALAFYNKGLMGEALVYFDKVLEYYGVRRPKNKVIALLNLTANLLSIIKNLYFPSKRGKKIPGKRDVEIINLIERRGAAFAQIDPTRFFMETIGLLRRLNKFDITKVENGVSIYPSCGILFLVTGISFKLSRKIADYAKNYISKNDIKSAFRYKYLELLYNLHLGDWNKEPEYDEVLVDHNIKIGDFFRASSYTQWYASLKIEQGNFSSVNRLVEKLCKIGEAYGHELSIGRKYSVKAKLLLNYRKLYDAQNEVDEGVVVFNRIGGELHSLLVLGMKSYIQILLEDINGAEKSLLQAKELASHKERIFPIYISNFLMSQFLFDLYMLKKSIHSKNKSKISYLQKKAYHSGKAAVKNAVKFAPDRTEAFKLMGVYFWLIGREKKALSWWDKSIKVGEHLNARPELARTYMEVGKRLMEQKSKFQQLNGIQAEEYLKKARVLFKEMEMEWELDQLDKIRS